MSAAERGNEANGAEQANKQVAQSLTSGFLVVLDHSGVKVDLGEGKDGSSGRMVA